MQEESRKGKNNGNSKSKDSKSKGKSKGKGKGKAKAENHVRDGSPVRELSASRQATDPWDDWHNAWAMENSQSTKGGQGTHQNHSQQQKQQHQNQKHNSNNHPNGQQSGSASAQNRRGRGGHVHAGQKRKAATESVTNGITGTDDGDHHGHAPKRHKSEKRPRPPPSSREPNANAPGAHPDFWYHDGSVIIQVEQTKFRLHQTKLQKQSAYFAAAFGKKENQKRGGREFEVDERSPDGRHIPVYCVTETTADDFATLLTVIEGITWMCVLY